MVVALLSGYNLRVSAQQLRADNLDEVVNALTLEEKCHLVLGCGMHFNDDAKLPMAYPVWVSLRPIALTLSRAFV